MSDRGAAVVVARRTVFAAAVAAAAVAFAERQPYARYETIVQRQMFGPLPPNFDPTKSPAEVSRSADAAVEKELTKEQEKVKSAIRFSVINVTPEGDTAVGFTDNVDPKNPVHYYLKVGESKGGWEVKEADAKSATMTVAKDGVEVTLLLGSDSAKGGAGNAESARPSAPAPVPQRSGLLGASLGARRRARLAQEEAERRATEAERAKREEERAKREEERAQREAEEKARRDAENEETRKQLEQIREELKRNRVRESPSQEPGSASEDGSGSDGE